MSIDFWLDHFQEAYKLPLREDIRSEVWNSKKFSEKEKKFLIQPYSRELVELQRDHIMENVQIFTRYFFKKAINGEAFCPLILIKNEFGKTLEAQYGLPFGPFINLARTYWTFRIELDEYTSGESKRLRVSMDYRKLLMFSILRTVEMNIQGIFFPASGPKTMSAVQRRMRQEQILKEFAPEIDIKRFISENPILKREAKSGCLGVLVLILVMLAVLILMLLVF